MSMTAVAQPSSYYPGAPRNGWTNGTPSQINLNAMSNDDLQRMFVPRKSARRTNSSSSLSSNTSSSSSSSNASTSTLSQPNGLVNGDSTFAARKKPAARSLWPSSKAEPVSGLSTARPQSSVAGSSASAASGLSALHNPNAMMNGQHNLPQHSQTNGIMRNPTQQEHAVLSLSPMNGTFERKTITVPFTPEVLKIGRQTNNKTFPTPTNGFFDSKVLSRQHAEVWADRDGRIWIRDVKSSNGTFVNSKRLSLENRDSEPHPLDKGDLLELGIDIVSEDQKTVVHHKVAAKVDYAGILGVMDGLRGVDLGELDHLSAGQLGQHQGQPMNFRNRQMSQGSAAGNARFAAQNGQYAPYHQKWLQPITMEQIVRRLHNELRNAQVQSQDLRVTSNFVDAILSHANTLSEPAPPGTSPSKPNENKSRFAAEPPAPPPSHPLPEKPDIIARSLAPDSGPLKVALLRSDTEKPKSPDESRPSSSKGESSGQIVSLIEALRNAQMEISNQAGRLREMETALQREREARNTAEEKAVQLASAGVNSAEGSSSSPTTSVAEQTDQDLQDRVDAMRATIDEMKLQMESYKRRADSAEQESKRDRQSLAEMVESIRRRDEAARKRKQARKLNGDALLTGAKAHSSQRDGTAEEDTEHTPIDDSFSDDDLDGEVTTVLSRHLTKTAASERGDKGQTNGIALAPLSDTQLKELSSVVSAAADSLRKGGHVVDSNGLIVQQTRSVAQDRMVQSAPYVSIIGVVFLGVGMMAWMNGWQKLER